MTSNVDFEAIWSAIPNPALVVGADDRVILANSAAESFTSMSVKQLQRRPIQAFVGENSILVDLINQARGAGVTFAQYDIEIAWLDRIPQTAHVHAAPVHDRPGQVFVQVVPRGIAEKMDRSLTSRSAARSVVGMAAMLAHEIKNPLAGISGAAQLLGMTLDEDNQELTTLIREEAERISKLLERVEQFGDLRAVVQEPVNIHDILQRAKLSAQSGFGSHVRFIEDYDPSLPPTMGDADQLMQVMLNLIKNAAEATPKVGGIVTLRTAFRPGVALNLPGGGRERLPLQISISDNGSGVPEELKKDLFEPFVSSKSTGSGLGLALVSKVMADHGGVVECESDPGWTTFRLLMPVWKAPKCAKNVDMRALRQEVA